MKEWAFPSFAFFAFLYFIGFLWFYVYNYSNTEVKIFTNTNNITSQDSIDLFLREISKSFKN